MNKDIKAVLGKLRAFLRLGGLQCGTSPRDRKTGTDLYVWIMQASALLPAVYLFILSGYPALAAGRNIPAFLFEAGIASLPRTEAHLLACLYRWTARETLLHMALLIAALVFGLAAGWLLHGYGSTAEKRARTSRIVLAALIAADLLLRLQPFVLRLQFSRAASVIGALVRGVCLLLVLADLAE
ncbi:MAG: hypothetical protein IKG66_09815 [Lachnospiraceae bacterium]|nr:hypothetical protein [Lachnospiraceae bacterium]